MFSLSQNLRRTNPGQGLHPGWMSFPKWNPYCWLCSLSPSVSLAIWALELDFFLIGWKHWPWGQEGNPQEQYVPIPGWMEAHWSLASAMLGRREACRCCLLSSASAHSTNYSPSSSFLCLSTLFFGDQSLLWGYCLQSGITINLNNKPMLCRMRPAVKSECEPGILSLSLPILGEIKSTCFILIQQSQRLH